MCYRIAGGSLRHISRARTERGRTDFYFIFFIFYLSVSLAAAAAAVTATTRYYILLQRLPTRNARLGPTIDTINSFFIIIISIVFVSPQTFVLVYTTCARVYTWVCVRLIFFVSPAPPPTIFSLSLSLSFTRVVSSRVQAPRRPQIPGYKNLARGCTYTDRSWFSFQRTWRARCYRDIPS